MFFRSLARKVNREIWTEQMIRLYERQLEAREKLGTKWCCHPDNAVHAGTVIVIEEYGPVTPEMWSALGKIPYGRPSLRVVK